MNKVDIAGLKIDPVSKQEFLEAALKRIKAGQKTSVFTPYSEFLYHAFQDPKLLEVFNSADFSLADGIGIFWAKRYLEIPLTAKSYWGKILQALWQLKYSLAAIIFNPRWIKSALPEKIVGADLVWDLAKLAADNNLSIFLLGGFGDTPELAAKKVSDFLGREKSSLLKSSKTQLFWSNKNPNDPGLIEELNNTAADILLVAYGPIKQEKWIYENLPKLNAKLAIGLGGTFDYLAGKKSAPPKFIRYSGLEWLWRLFTQPHRIKRIIHATFGLAYELFLYKIFQTMPYRKNVVSVVLKANTVFISKRNPDDTTNYARSFEKNKYLNYWQLPQGGVHAAEEIVNAAKRELMEETNMSSLKLLKISAHTHTYNFTPSLKRLFDREYSYKGQTQTIVYFKFLGKQQEIVIDKRELLDHKWVEWKNLADAVHEERQALAKIVEQDLKEMQEKAMI